jgi:hypothetical protein
VLNNLSGLRTIPTIIAPKQHIFLLSHMRAYTSLFGHIMGSNPEICGYYEMHIGYHSWKSLIRQKMLYFEQEDPKPGFSYMFDKVLHSDHYVSSKVLNSSQARSIICLRRPRDVIPSIVKLYQSIDPSHEFNSASFATNYYIERLTMLQRIAEELKQGYFYLDAESLKQDPGTCLGYLSEWLQLKEPLSPTYQLQKNTSRERYGDTSEALRSGRITQKKVESSNFSCDENLIENANSIYSSVRKVLIEKSAQNSIIQPEAQ